MSLSILTITRKVYYSLWNISSVNFFYSIIILLFFRNFYCLNLRHIQSSYHLWAVGMLQSVSLKWPLRESCSMPHQLNECDKSWRYHPLLIKTFKFKFWLQSSFKIFGGHKTYCNVELIIFAKLIHYYHITIPYTGNILNILGNCKFLEFLKCFEEYTFMLFVSWNGVDG